MRAAWTGIPASGFQPKTTRGLDAKGKFKIQRKDVI